MKEARRNKSSYKDQDGKFYCLEKSDPLIEKMNLVGIRKGVSPSFVLCSCVVCKREFRSGNLAKHFSTH
jgi:hypothetical protein